MEGSCWLKSDFFFRNFHRKQKPLTLRIFYPWIYRGNGSGERKKYSILYIFCRRGNFCWNKFLGNIPEEITNTVQKQNVQSDLHSFFFTKKITQSSIFRQKISSIMIHGGIDVPFVRKDWNFDFDIFFQHDWTKKRFAFSTWMKLVTILMTQGKKIKFSTGIIKSIALQTSVFSLRKINWNNLCRSMKLVLCQRWIWGSTELKWWDFFSRWEVPENKEFSYEIQK